MYSSPRRRRCCLVAELGAAKAKLRLLETAAAAAAAPLLPLSETDSAERADAGAADGTDPAADGSAAGGGRGCGAEGAPAEESLALPARISGVGQPAVAGITGDAEPAAGVDEASPPRSEATPPAGAPSQAAPSQASPPPDSDTAPPAESRVPGRGVASGPAEGDARGSKRKTIPPASAAAADAAAAAADTPHAAAATALLDCAEGSQPPPSAAAPAPTPAAAPAAHTRPGAMAAATQTTPGKKEAVTDRSLSVKVEKGLPCGGVARVSKARRMRGEGGAARQGEGRQGETADEAFDRLLGQFIVTEVSCPPSLPPSLPPSQPTVCVPCQAACRSGLHDETPGGGRGRAQGWRKRGRVWVRQRPRNVEYGGDGGGRKSEEKA